MCGGAAGPGAAGYGGRGDGGYNRGAGRHAAEKDAIDEKSSALKLKKNAMDAGQYDAQLEQLLTELALKTKAIRDLQTKKDKP